MSEIHSGRRRRRAADLFGGGYPAQAVDYYLEGHDAGRLLDATGPRGWVVCLAITLLAASAFAVGLVGRADVVTSAPARVAPDGRSAVAFVTARERPSIVPGAAVALELGAAAEGGGRVVRARVRSVDTSAASEAELCHARAAAAESSGAVHRVELDVLGDDARVAAALAVASPPARARITTGNQRLLSLILQPQRAWGK